MEFYKQMFGGAWITQGLWVAAELGIADLLADGPCKVEELAAKTGAHAGSLYRVLRALAGVGVFSHDGHGRFSLTPLADLLRSDVPGSQRALAILMGGEFHAAWGELLHSAKTGEPGFNKKFGMPFFQYVAEHPDRHDFYDAAMEGVHGRETQPMLNAYDFSAFGTVIDVGGGNGSTVVGILARHPAVQGILFDLPAVAERARSGLVGSNQANRLHVVGGDFFSAVPGGADVYLLRHVIHDWLDEDAVSILRNCRDAMSPGAKVLVVEMVLPSENEPSFGKWLDLMMLLVAGKERTEAEYSQLFTDAGLRMTRVIPTESDVSIVEGVPAS
ncbi:MAG: methyltransferase [Candidatus Kuenenia sp.]|nr:methyltransferase [Candidatus Kuenenia hertensis]